MSPRIFTFAPGAPPLKTFCRHLLEGALAPGIGGADLASLSQARIYAPTRRAARALASELARQAGEATFLPEIRALGDPEEPENGFTPLEAFGGEHDSITQKPALGELERRLLLGRMILQFAQSSQNDAPAPLLTGARPADAIALARELGGLIDEFIIEECDPAKLSAAAPADHSYYWDLSARFLRIAWEEWPKTLQTLGRSEMQAWRAQAVERQIAILKQAGEAIAPIVVGSTGTHKTTQRLMRAILDGSRGAVVLPGLDARASPQAWREILSGEPVAFSHPQASMARLLQFLKIDREQVQILEPGDDFPTAPAGRRVAFVNAAMTPAAQTPSWRNWRANHAQEDSLGDTTLIEAPNENLEALAIAVSLREVLETPKLTAALVTPDREISARVRAQLRRWNLDVDDSAGEILAVTPAGRFARLALDCLAQDFCDVAILSLLSHDFCALLETRAQTRRAAQTLEQAILRMTFASSDFDRRYALAQHLRGEDRPHPIFKNFDAQDFDAAWLLRRALDTALAPLGALAKGAPLNEWAQAHRAALEALTVGQALAATPDVLGVQDFLQELSHAEGGAFSLNLEDYAGLFANLAREKIVRGPRNAHPRLKILGLLEARLIEADVVVVAGLDETIWPPAPHNGAFINRPLRQHLGLAPPERRIGLSAHDFLMCMGAPRVILTRAKKRGGAPTHPSRFLQRMEALHPETFPPAREKGRLYLHWAQALDAPRNLSTRSRPAPKPPVALRPARLSVTRIETLRRDPYAIYAEQILKLTPLGALDAAPGAAEIGTATHGALEKVFRAGGGFVPPDARALALAALAQELADLLKNPSWRAFAWPRLAAGIDFVLDYARQRREDLRQVEIEASGAVTFALQDGSDFRLTAKADRIEIDHEGQARIVDYKTGDPPSVKQVAIGLSPQLTLEAKMLSLGGFAKLGPCPIESLFYLRMGGREGGKARAALGDRTGPEMLEVIDAHWRAMREMLSSYRRFEHGYVSRPLAQFVKIYGTYDHLARVKEWALGEP